jgi:hypothetical protein
LALTTGTSDVPFAHKNFVALQPHKHFGVAQNLKRFSLHLFYYRDFFMLLLIIHYNTVLVKKIGVKTANVKIVELKTVKFFLKNAK